MRSRKALVGSLSLGGVVLAMSAGACGSREGGEDEAAQRESQGLATDGSSTDAGTCRELTLRAGDEPEGEEGRDEGGSRRLAPPLSFALPRVVSVARCEGRAAATVELVVERSGGGETVCSYASAALPRTPFGGAKAPSSRDALFVSCSDGARAGATVVARELELQLVSGPCESASVTLRENGACASSDAGFDSGGTTDAGRDTGTVDAATDAATVDSGPACTPATCVAPSACTLARCTSAGCTLSPAPLGTACVASACTVGDACDGAGSCVPGAALPIDDLNPCTSDQCDPVLGVLHAPVADGTTCAPNACTVGATCQAGVCSAGAPRDCTSNNACVIDGCAATTGCTHVPRPAGDLACSDGDVCNGIEQCSGTGTCLPGTPLAINDGQICTIDACSPTAGVSHTPIDGCDPTPTSGEAPFETRASVMGRLVLAGAPAVGATFTVTDAPVLPTTPAPPPRTDVVAQSAGDGSFRLRLASFPDVAAARTPPAHVIVRIDAPGALPAWRDAWLHTGDAVDFGVIALAARDAAVTTIGPAGGIARDSLDRIQIVVPPGALAAPVPIVITPIATRSEMPFPLPVSTPTLYGFVFEPEGTTFASPITVRLTNWRSAPTSFPIPVGLFDPNHGRWDAETQATWDATLARFVFTTSTFSLRDCNPSRPRAPIPDPGPDPDPGPHGCSDSDVACGSTGSVRGGGVRNDVRLPGYLAKNEEVAVGLEYNSELAGGRSLGTAPSDYGAVARSTFAVPLRGMRFRSACIASAASPGAPESAQVGRCTPQLPSGTTCSLGQQTPVPFTIAWSLAARARRPPSR